MTNGGFRLMMVAGLFLGVWVLFFYSLTTFMNKKQERMLLEKQIKHDLIEEASFKCDPVYPVVHAAIYLDRIIVECRTD